MRTCTYICITVGFEITRINAQYCLYKLGVIASIIMGLVSISGSAMETLYIYEINVYFNMVYTSCCLEYLMWTSA